MTSPSGIPVAIGGESYTLLLTPLDVDLIEKDRDRMIIYLLTEQQIQKIGTIASFLHFGLKVPGKFDANGIPARALPVTSDGHLLALELVRQETKGDHGLKRLVELGNLIGKAVAAGDWFNFAATLEKTKKEADTSVPQGDGTPKNSEEPGSSSSSQ